MKLILTALFALTTPALAQTPYSRAPIAYVGVNVLPMTSETVLENQTVYIREGVIEGIGPADSFFVPEGTTRIERPGAYLMPGLCDLHVHFFGGRDGNADTLDLYLANGITTVLNMRGSRGTLQMRDDILSGEALGPRLYTTSPILGNLSPTPATFDKGVEMVESFHEDGYDFVKVYNRIPEEGSRGVVEAAKRLGIPLVGHAVRSVGIDGAIEAGQHIAHMEELLYGYFDDVEPTDEAIAALAARMKDAGISVIATLIAYHNIIRQVDDLEAMLASPGVDVLEDRLVERWDREHNEYLSAFDAEETDRVLRPGLALQQKLVRMFHDAGVPILLGTDAMIPVVVPGYSAHDELQELVEAGLTPYEALAAGTRDAAAFLNDDAIGTIEAGKRADLVLLANNPLEDITHTTTILGTCVRGQWLDRDQLNTRLNTIRQRKAE